MILQSLPSTAYSDDVYRLFRRDVNRHSGDVNKVGAQRRWDCNDALDFKIDQAIHLRFDVIIVSSPFFGVCVLSLLFRRKSRVRMASERLLRTRSTHRYPCFVPLT